ncbi:MAG TPA: hypothetical protein VMB03_15535 [Bryobacteraceae bacterium]|nr:hypothetical protein [Bryobacteraceae bacterium]
MSAYRDSSITLTAGSYPEQIASVEATAASLHLFGAPIERGRGFAKREDLPGSRHVAVITDELWHRRLAVHRG